MDKSAQEYELATNELAEKLDFIDKLDLIDISDVHLREVTNQSGFIDAGSLVSFVANVSTQHQQDVLNSFLLAQLAATAKFDRENQTIEWYNFYRTVLENVGWVIQNFSFDKFNASGSQFTVDKVVLEILEAIASQDEMAVAQATMDALKALDNGDGRLVLFESTSHSLQKGNFQIAIATETGGVVALKIGAFHFQSTNNVTKVLFFSFSDENTSFHKSSQTINLNESIYRRVRGQIINKLGDRAKRFVADLNIGD
jgi:hypothetical protein